MPDETVPTATATVPETPPATDPVPQQASAVDFSPMEEGRLVRPHIENGWWLITIATMAYREDDAGQIAQFTFEISAAEEIKDSFGETIPEGRKLGKQSMFVGQSQYRSLQQCIDGVKQISCALNNIVIDKVKDPKGAKATEAWKALPDAKKRPAYIKTDASRFPILDADPASYAQWNETVVLGRFQTKNGMTNLQELAAKDTPRMKKGK